MTILEAIKLGKKGLKPADVKSINEAGVPTDDVISLIDAGYSVNEMNELISLSKEPSPEPTVELPDQPKETERQKQVEDTKNAEIEKLQSQIKQMQIAAGSKRLEEAPQKSNADKLKDVLKSIY